MERALDELNAAAGISFSHTQTGSAKEGSQSGKSEEQQHTHKSLVSIL